MNQIDSKSSKAQVILLICAFFKHEYSEVKNKFENLETAEYYKDYALNNLVETEHQKRDKSILKVINKKIKNLYA